MHTASTSAPTTIRIIRGDILRQVDVRSLRVRGTRSVIRVFCVLQVLLALAATVSAQPAGDADSHYAAGVAAFGLSPVRGSEAGEYLSRLLPLPAFLTDPKASASPVDIHNGFRLTGHFLGERLFADLNKPVPEARFLMIDRLERAGRLSPS